MPLISFRNNTGRCCGDFAVVRNLIANCDLIDIDRVCLPVVESLTDGYPCKAVRIELRRPRFPDRSHEGIEWQLNSDPRVRGQLLQAANEPDARRAFIVHIFQVNQR